MVDSMRILVPRDLLEATIDLLRKDMFALHELGRKQHLEILFQLYILSGFYPSDPPLQGWEVATADIEPIASAEYADIWKGMFLGRQKVALKRIIRRRDDDLKGAVQMSSLPAGYADKWKGMFLGRQKGTITGSLKRDDDLKDAVQRVNIGRHLWNGLRHPNILPTIGLVTDGIDIGPCLISPWMDCGDLLEYLHHHADVPCLPLIGQIADGLEYLHTYEPPIVHGGLKGDTIFISSTGNAFIGDFRLLQTFSDIEQSRGSMSSSWRTPGNPRWMAPELLLDDTAESRSLSSDVFAFGRVIHECFTRRDPWAGFSSARIIFVVSRGELPPRPLSEDVISRGLDDNMWRLMEHCWNLNPSERPTIQHIARHLRPAIQSPRRKFQYFYYASEYLCALFDAEVMNSILSETQHH
ncbi:hypothetical protein BOTBODRAFT_449167 [Botryobasidium botryosum FD-172 SS1]|uniref:Protein kinase domain-containing protein n=1 Tax=Botryobasidium botryosum (strain FD-172 SS1) TaxID=930990 RepID=A0A067MIH0_BOTB1|nr:hypothetical protein BOTBODRAFT_449167 [Botryobasidium botryosum FD-172 SS1]